MGKIVIWTHQAGAELNEVFLDLLEQSQSIETTTRIITEIYESVSILAKNHLRISANNAIELTL